MIVQVPRGGTIDGFVIKCVCFVVLGEEGMHVGGYEHLG